MSAQLKPKGADDRDVELTNRRSDVFEIRHAKAKEELEDEIQGAVHLMLDLVLSNYEAGDDAQNGDILKGCITGLARRIRMNRIGKELREEFQPSWKSRAEG
jgi:hypothetical protein